MQTSTHETVLLVPLEVLEVRAGRLEVRRQIGYLRSELRDDVRLLVARLEVPPEAVDLAREALLLVAERAQRVVARELRVLDVALQLARVRLFRSARVVRGLLRVARLAAEPFRVVVCRSLERVEVPPERVAVVGGRREVVAEALDVAVDVAVVRRRRSLRPQASFAADSATAPSRFSRRASASAASTSLGGARRFSRSFSSRNRSSS